MTQVTFKPDPEILTELDYNFETLNNRLREMAFLNKGLTIVLTDERDGAEEKHQYEGGLASFVAYVRGARHPLHEEVFYFEASREEADIEVALQYDDRFSENTHTFVNNINTHEGGAHLTGLKRRSPGPSTTTPAGATCSRRPTRASRAMTCGRG